MLCRDALVLTKSRNGRAASEPCYGKGAPIPLCRGIASLAVRSILQVIAPGRRKHPVTCRIFDPWRLSAAREI